VLVHRAARIGKKLLPSSLFKAVRAVTTGILTPFTFSYQTGHFRSSLKSRALDKSGKAIPWYTYPAIDFLRQKEMNEKSVLEFGSGQSTLWWAARVKTVSSFESDAAWFNYVVNQIPNNVTLTLTDDSAAEVPRLLDTSKFDVIIVDGLDRLICARMSIAFLNEGGAVIVDNSEGYWGRDGEYPIIDFFRAEGFSRIDFYGYAPGVILPSCTSLFFRDSCFLLAGSESPARLVN
jgi:hypothetical protein